MLYNFGCINGHETEAFEHHRDDLGCRTLICEECDHTMGPTLSLGKPLLFFSEKNPRIIENLSDKPVKVTSHKQHKDLMKEAGVTFATPKRGEKGCWT